MAQVRRLGSNIGSLLALFCIHRVNRMNSRSDSSHDVSTNYYNYNTPVGYYYRTAGSLEQLGLDVV